MDKSELLPPNQIVIARNALLGNPPSQRAVLEMAVALSDAGIDPVAIFKVAALESLRMALKMNKLQSPKRATIKGSAGNEFATAVAWWKLKLTGSPKPHTELANQLDPDIKKNVKPAITRAVQRHGKLAKERALFELAWHGQDGPNLKWMDAWETYRDELLEPMRKAIDKFPDEIAQQLRQALF